MLFLVLLAVWLWILLSLLIPGRRRLELRVTREGAGYMVLTLLFGVAAINTASNLLYLTTGALLSVLLVSGVSSTRNLRGIRAGRGVLPRARAGEPVPIPVVVRNESRFSASSDVVVTQPCPEGEPGRWFVPRIAARGQVAGVVVTTFGRRGEVTLPPLQVASAFPFRFLRKWREEGAPAEMLVWPAQGRLAAEGVSSLLRGGRLGEAGSSGRSGAGDEVLGLREYRPGDPARHIHWRRTARTGDPVVKLLEERSGRAVTLVLAAREAQTPRAREEAVSLAATLLVHVLERGMQVDVLTDEGGAGRAVGVIGPGGAPRALNLLARYPAARMEGAGEEERPEAALDGAGRRICLVIGPDAPEERGAVGPRWDRQAVRVTPRSLGRNWTPPETGLPPA